MDRNALEIKFTIANGATLSDAKWAGGGAFGTLIVPSGSSLIGKTIQFVAHSPTAKYADTDLLSTPISITAAGAYSLSSDEIAEVGAVNTLKMKASAAVTGDTEFYLLWKA